MFQDCIFLMRWQWFGLGVVVACFAGACAQPPAPVSRDIRPTDSPQRAATIAADEALMVGKEQYDLRCGHCHGFGGEGQVATTIENTLSLGMNTVPAHDATGHTWQHPDQLLVEVIKRGIQNPLDQFPMPPFAAVMSDDEMYAVLEYMKLWWTDDQRAYQAGLTAIRARIEAEELVPTPTN